MKKRLLAYLAIACIFPLLTLQSLGRDVGILNPIVDEVRKTLAV